MRDHGGSGAVARASVLEVFRRHHVDVAEGEDGESVILAGNGAVEAHVLMAYIPRRQLHRFARVFDIPIEHFYHPEMAAAH